MTTRRSFFRRIAGACFGVLGAAYAPSLTFPEPHRIGVTFRRGESWFDATTGNWYLSVYMVGYTNAIEWGSKWKTIYNQNTNQNTTKIIVT